MTKGPDGAGRSEPGVTRRGVLAGGLAGAGGIAAAGVAPDAAGEALLRRVGEPRDGTAAAEVVGDQFTAAITAGCAMNRLIGDLRGARGYLAAALHPDWSLLPQKIRRQVGLG